MDAEPQEQHKWLQQLVGQWTYESEAKMGPDKPAAKFRGIETVRTVGGLWVIGESQGEMPGGGTAEMVITLGFDPAKGRFVGTFIGSMMTHLWIYDGELDAAGKTLTLNAEGPDMSPGAQPGKMGQYRDVVEIVSTDYHILRSLAQSDDSSWVQFMAAHYRRKA
jgi:hypothetical protein